MASGVASAQSVGGFFSGWKGTASLGASITTGNTESSSVNGSLRLLKTHNRWEHVLTASAFQGDATVLVAQTDATGAPVTDANGFPVNEIVEGDTSDRLTIGYQPKYYFTDAFYGFGLFDLETDEPANIDSSSRQIIGVGYSFFRNNSGFLSAEIGVGNQSLELVNGPNADSAIGYLGANYLNQFNDVVTFNADFRADFGSENTFIEVALGAAFKLSTRFSFKVDYFIRTNTDLSDPSNPLDGDTDTVTTFNLVVDI